MCDYSLAGIPNRLAVEGEQLVAYRFSTGAIGLTSPDASRWRLWSKKTPAVCVLPGACLGTVLQGGGQKQLTVDGSRYTLDGGEHMDGVGRWIR